MAPAEPDLCALPPALPLDQARRVLVLAPHPDDETIGCGGLLAQLAARGVATKVLLVSDGSGAGELPPGTAELRQQEFRAALAVLGGIESEWLGLPDGALDRVADLPAQLRRAIEAFAPNWVFGPSTRDPHRDHRAVAAALAQVLPECAGVQAAWSYETWTALTASHVLDIGAELPVKLAALREHRTALACGNYLQATEGLARYRSLLLGGPQAQAAEAFEQVRRVDVAEPRPAPLREQAEPGSGPAPRISVLVRSMDRASLPATLASVQAQQLDPPLEIVLVNASGRAHSAPPAELRGPHALRLIEPGRALARAAAANCALQHARGELLLLLDDDDALDAEHLARLLRALDAAPHAVAAYAGVRIVDEQGREQGQLDEAFDGLRLWRANYLPIHAVLFRRSALDQGPSFAEALAVYEDWDFWLQLARQGAFIHVPGCSAEYHMAGASGLGPGADPAFVAQARTAVYARQRGHLTAVSLEALLAQAEQVAVQRQQALDGLDRERRVGLALEQRCAEQAEMAAAQLQAAQAAQAGLDAARVEAAGMQRYQHQLLRELDLQRKTYQGLEQAYRAQQASLSWRITAPLRSVRGLASPQGLRRLARALPLAPARKQRLKLWLSTAPWGRALLRRLAPGAPAAPPGPPALDKEAVRREAEAALDRFLAGSERLGFDDGAAAPQLSVIVVLYNQAGLTLYCLQALAAARGVRFELLVVDNASSDRVPALLERIDGATLLPQTENLGFLRAVNLAARQARGEHLLLLNNDAVVEPDTLARAWQRLQAEPDAGAVGGPILLWDGRLQEAGSIVWNDGSCLGYGRGDDPEAGPYRFVRDVDYCSGAFLVLRRRLWEQLGGFDERYAPAYYEESDLCLRLIEAGHRIVYDPRVRVRHFEFASDAGSGRALELQARNRLRFVDAHQAQLRQQQAPTPAHMLAARQRLKPGACRVLVIDDRTPLPWLGQGYPRACSLVQALVAAGHAVTHYPLQFPHEDWADVYRALPDRVEVMLGLGLAGLAEFLAARQGHYQLLIVSRPHNMQVLSALRARSPELFAGLRWVYDAEALFSLREIAKAAVQGRALGAAQQQRLIQDELALVRDADTVLAVSEAEAAQYRAAGFADVRVLGHALRPQPTPAGFEARRGFLFVGAIQSDDSPNGDSLLWFVREAWPLIQAELGEAARLDIVGPCDSAAVRALAGARIHVHGKVEQLEPWLNQARVFLAPTRFAAGIPHKAHEAAGAGVPLVASALIAQQLGWQDWLPQGQAPQEFAAACVRLHREAEHWGALRDRGLAAVASDCDPAVFERQVLGLLPASAPSLRSAR